MSIKLKVKPISPSIANGSYDNCVYLSPNDYGTIKVNWVEVRSNANKMFAQIVPYEEVPVGFICLNIQQRTFLDTEFGAVVSVTKTEDDKMEKVGVVNFDVKCKAQNHTIIQNDDLKLYILKMQYISKVPFCIKINDVNMILTPTLLINSINKPIDGGVIKDKTEISFITTNNMLSLNDSKAPKMAMFKKGDTKTFGIGGLTNELDEMYVRAFSTRMLPYEVIKRYNIKHIKGILLYGPPGCGKTLVAREIGNFLGCKIKPKIVSGPELMNKYVGESEANVRKLFEEAEADKNPDNLHIIIIDECDAIGRVRGSRGDNTGVGDNIVNQMLAKLDGVNSLNNVLLICMTNKEPEYLDQALLRPGRLEIKIKIDLPDECGRYEILKIHTKELEKNNGLDPKIDLKELATQTKGYTGAELEAIIKASRSYAISRVVSDETQMKKPDAINIYVTQEDIAYAIEHDVKPMFGKMSDKINKITSKKFIKWNDDIKQNYDSTLEQIKKLKKGCKLTFVLRGTTYTGKTLMACNLANESEYTCMRMISSENIDPTTAIEERCRYVIDKYNEVVKAESGILIIDQYESLIGWNMCGNQFQLSNMMVQTINKLVRQNVDNKNRTTIIITITESSDVENIMEMIGAINNFDDIYMLSSNIDSTGIKNILDNYEDGQHNHLYEELKNVKLVRALFSCLKTN